MQVDTSAAPASTERDGQRYYFCSDRCHDAFTTDHDTTHGNMS